ncbi:MAG: porin, partial [Burkholderiaceae bacterium]
WLAGSEDLGGGNAAVFYVENRFDTDVGPGASTGLSAGETYFGLKGGFGQATIGRHSLYNTQGLATEITIGNGGVAALPTSLYATYSILDYVGGTAISSTRVNNSIKYTTPNFGGLTGSIGYSTNNAGNEGTYVANNSDYSNGSVWVLTGNYTNGPVYLNAAYWANNIEGRPVNQAAAVTAATADTRAYRLSGSYKFSFGLKVGVQYDRASLQKVGHTSVLAGADQNRTAWEVPVSYAFGNSTILASYTKAGNISNTAGDTGAKLWVLGYDYALSKRTNVGVYAGKLTNGAQGTYQPYQSGALTGSTLLAGESASTIALGIKHTF